MDFSLVAGAICFIAFSKGCSVEEGYTGSFTLNVNSSGAKAFVPHFESSWGSNGDSSWDFYYVFYTRRGVMVIAVYDGSKWHAINNIHNAHS